MQAVFVALFALGVVVSVNRGMTTDKPPPDEPKAAGQLDGGYTIVSGERDGKPIPEDEIKGALVRFTLGEVVGTDKDRKEFFAATYTVDTKKKPWTINMKSIAPTKPDVTGGAPKDGATATGLVKKEGDTLTLIYALPGGDAPTEFKTKAKQQMFVLKSFAAEPVESNKFEKSP
jgi:uncharacterized protein (TIGR03067 family)